MDALNSKCKKRKLTMNSTAFIHDPIFSVVTIVLQMLGFILTIKYYDKKPALQKVKKITGQRNCKTP